MSDMSVQGAGFGNGVVPGFQEGGGVSEKAIDKMENKELVNLLQNGSPIDRQNALKELMERLGATQSEGSEGAGGGGGGIEGVDDELKKILEKLMKGEKLEPEEVTKLLGALAKADENI